MAKFTNEQYGYSITAISSLSSFATSQAQYKMDQSARAHRQVMADIGKRLSLNALTDQEASTRDALMRTEVAINLQSRSNKAQAELSAAVAGVAGVSVRSQQTGLERSRLRAINANTRNTRSAMRAAGLQRRNVSLSAIFGEDISTIIPPSFASAALGLGVSLLDQWDSNQPKGAGLMDTRL